ncbi:MAG: LVIVD repeat-containing protein [Saprospiraceae bacterium]
MKIKATFFALLAIAATSLLSGCLRDTCTSTRTYIRFDPVYKTPSEFRVPAKAEAPRALKNPGKMYLIGDYLLINEVHEGIHVLDNSDPASPKPVVFWNIPGNVDMAIRDHYLYADQYVDLVSIDISDLHNPTTVCRSEGVFQLHGFNAERGFLVDYLQTPITEEVACDDQRWNGPWFMEGDFIFVGVNQLNTGANGPRKTGSGLPAGIGTAGSYSRFGQYDNYLYCVDNFTLRPFSVASPSCPSALAPINIGWNIETIFPWGNKLFVGSQTGVFIFDASNPANPVQEASFNHASGCDPVVCDNDNAYVTIHDGTTCNGTFNQLDVIDIRSLPATSLRITYPMKKPKGLSVYDKYLYLCDEGLKVFDKSDPLKIKLLSHVTGITTYDVIALDETHILVVGDGGFYQYDVTDPAAPRKISQILVAP